jgi:hypothetical protein
MKVAPRASFAVVHSRPLCASTIEQQIDRPIPTGCSAEDSALKRTILDDGRPSHRLP